MHILWTLRAVVLGLVTAASVTGCDDSAATGGAAVDAGLAAFDAGFIELADGARVPVDAPRPTSDGGTAMDGGAAAPDGAASGADGWSLGDGPFRFLDAVTVREDGGTWQCVPVICAGQSLACGDCVDNDGDGRVDARDPECLGPCDNTEGPVLLAGVGGERGGPCLADCYFDFGNGAGNDQCRWDSRCDPLSVSPRFDPEGPACAYDSTRVGGRTCPRTQATQCLDRCRPITPNGCDCFGCCTFPQLAGRGANGGPGYVWLGSTNAAGEGTCTLGRITDPDACRPCTPVAGCNNPCDACEVCVGRPGPDPSCGRPVTDAGVPRTDGGGGTGNDAGPSDAGGGAPRDASGPAVDAGSGGGQCLPGIQPCGLEGQALCPLNAYCITGCCVVAPQ